MNSELDINEIKNSGGSFLQASAVSCIVKRKRSGARLTFSGKEARKLGSLVRIVRSTVHDNKHSGSYRGKAMA